MRNKFTIRIVIAFSILIALVILLPLWWWQATSPVKPNDATPTIFVVQKGENVRSIANRLKNEGLIRDSIAFFVTVRLLGIDDTLQAGDFRLNPGMNTHEIAQELTHGILDVWVTTLEGWRVEEIAMELSKKLAIPEAQFIDVATEGYMFPDTYLIPQQASASAVAKLFEETFDARFTDEMRAKAQKAGMSVDEVVTLASIVEREVRTDRDRPIVAGILLKRLENDWPLDTDATVQYALGYQVDQKTWWKKHLTESDLNIKSPYNTRRVGGLPPTPICSPGLASLTAVVEPQVSDYWFYLSDDNGVTHYAKTLEEHEENSKRYLQN